MTSTREQILTATCTLMEMQGYHATGLNEIVKASGAPKGSLYYHFPQGKEEIAAQAVLQSGQLLAERTRAGLAADASPSAAVGALAETIAGYIETSGFQAGGPLQAVAVETASTSERLNAACREAYQLLQAAFEDKLREAGIAPERAAQLAGLITAAFEGGIILSRTYHSGDPLRRVGAEIAAVLAREEKSEGRL
jgi:TetR/AcrR family transcriptional regulator, lmrAB and yxaGH operons repressor